MVTRVSEDNEASATDWRALCAEWVTVPDVAQAWGVEVTRVRQAIRDRHLAATHVDGVLQVPRVLLAGEQEIKGLHGVLTLLADAGYTSDEALQWLLTDDPSLPGAPAQALAENRGTEVKRRAQSLGF